MAGLEHVPNSRHLSDVRERCHEYVTNDGTPTCWQSAMVLKVIFDAKWPLGVKEIAERICLPEIETRSILSKLQVVSLIEETFDFSRTYKWSDSPSHVLRKATEEWLESRFETEISRMTVEYRQGLRERLGT